MIRVLPQSCDVAIVGAGPTGLMLANLLGMGGIHTVVFERRGALFSDPRAIAFDPETLRLFQTIGGYEALKPTLELDVPVHYLNAAGKTLAHLTECPSSFGHSGRGTFYQPELEAVLASRLNEQQSVSLVRGVEVNAVDTAHDGVRLTLGCNDGVVSQCTARYLVDCSGGSSSLRSQLGIEFSGETFSEKWLVIDVEDDDYAGREIRFFCDPQRPAVTLPVSRNRRRWEFLVLPGDDEDEFASHANARKLMAAHGAGKRAKIVRSLVYTFHARCADTFRRHRVLLAGDSAHVMPPFAGQGLNSGLRDAANLAWKLDGVLKGRFRESILDSYEQERRPHVEAMTRLAVRLGGTIMPTNRVRAWLRDRFMLTAWRFPGTRRKVNRGDMIPKPSIEGSALANWDSSGEVGRMIDQPLLQSENGTLPLDDVIGPSFAAIGVNCRVEASLHDDDLERLQAIGASVTSVSSASEQAFDYRDQSGSLDRLAGRTPAVLVVRPDRFLIDVIKAGGKTSRLAWLSDAYGLY
ncbi:MAG: bifunctional 3-(3-hydroxy-phenyl)propionate/3-hydroxycinnamic acid hydroxylase [Pseudomonadota bacterium]